MNTNGHYNVTYGLYSISRIRCLHCDFSVHPHDYYRAGDKSGQGQYNRARALMVKHLHTEHRAILMRREPEKGNAMTAPTREGTP